MQYTKTPTCTYTEKAMNAAWHAGKTKRYNRLFYQCTLNDSSTYGHGATSFTQRKARKNPLKDKGVDGTP